MSELRVRVESIYDLALGKLLLDKMNVILVSPTKEQKDYLEVEDIADPHEVHIGDIEYRHGIQIKGQTEAVRDIEKLLRDLLPDSIVFRHNIHQDAIFNATVSKYIYRKRMAILELGNDEQGVLFNVDTNVGDQILVQIKELTTEKNKLPVCSRTITLTGDFIILEIGGNFVRVSRKIKGNDRKRLHALGKEILPPGYGIIIRTSANSIDNEKIIFEINKLRQLWHKINDQAKNSEDTMNLVAGELLSEIYMGNASKMFLDTVRSEILLTINNYHHFRAYSMATGFTADFAQNFVDKISLDELSNHLEKMIIERDYQINNHIKGEFNFLDGIQREFNLGNIIKTGDVIVTRLKLERDHNEQMPIFNVSEGDIVESYFGYGSWTIHDKYYSGLTNELLGEKLRIITPLDLIYRGRIRAFDMGMMLFKNMEGETKSIVDDAALDMVEKGMISKSLDEKLGEVLRVAMTMLKSSNDDVLLIHLGQQNGK